VEKGREEFGILNLGFWMLNGRRQANDLLANPSNWPTSFVPLQKLLDEEFFTGGNEGNGGYRTKIRGRP
jgi:hypothetical protein